MPSHKHGTQWLRKHGPSGDCDFRLAGATQAQGFDYYLSA